MPKGELLDKHETTSDAPTIHSSPAGMWSQVFVGIYLLALALLTLHLYRAPIYDMDSIQYMGNALLTEDTNLVRVHERVYMELRRSMPEPAIEQLLGGEEGAPEDQNQSRRERAADPYRLGEFLPLFAIHPAYNQALYVVSKTGVGLVRAGVLISVLSYFSVGTLLFAWMRTYVAPLMASIVSLVCMMTPPLTSLGRDTTSDALASLVAFASLYLTFGKRNVAAGMAFLLASIFFRTDFVVLAGPVILVCWLQQRLPLLHALVLSLLAVSSVLYINHFAGDYGIRMLYYRNFVRTPIAPAEMTVQFSAHDYLMAFRSGITKVAESFFLPFALLASIGFRSKPMQPLLAATSAYAILHFVILLSGEMGRSLVPHGDT